MIELKLAKSEARFRSIFENANMGIIFTDAKGNILQVNKHLVEMLGYCETDLIHINMSINSMD